MPKQPHNEHELELSLTRLAGSNLEAVKYRDMMSGVVLGQMLPAGTVVKGGSSLRLRFGPDNSRVTMDFDTARSVELGALEANIRKVFDIEGVEDLASGIFSADAAQSECGGGRRRQGEVHGNAEGGGWCVTEDALLRTVCSFAA